MGAMTISVCLHTSASLFPEAALYVLFTKEQCPTTVLQTSGFWDYTVVAHAQPSCVPGNLLLSVGRFHLTHFFFFSNVFGVLREADQLRFSV